MCNAVGHFSAGFYSVFQTSLIISKGTLARVLRLTEAKLKEVKAATKLRMENNAKKLSDEIDAYLMSHSSGLHLVKKKPCISTEDSEQFLFPVRRVRYIETDRIEKVRTRKENAKTLNALRSSIRSFREKSDGMFQLSVLDVSSFMLRYQALVSQVSFLSLLSVS